MKTYSIKNSTGRSILVPSKTPFDILKSGESRSFQLEEAVAERLSSIQGITINSALGEDTEASTEVDKTTPDQTARTSKK